MSEAPRPRRDGSPARSREQQEITLAPLDNHALANLCGPLDANLRQIEAALDVSLAHRGGSFTLTGPATQTKLAAEALRRFYAQAEKSLSVDDIQLGLIRLTLLTVRLDWPATKRARGCAHAAPTCTAARRTRRCT